MLTFDTNPSHRQLRQFSTTLGVLGLFAGVALANKLSGPSAIYPLAVSATLGTAGFAHPPLMRVPYVVLSAITYPVGFLVSFASMLVLYFFLVTPIGMARRTAKRWLQPDKIDTQTGWTPCRRQSVARYFHQF